MGQGLRTTLALALSAALVTAAVSLLLPKSYRAEAVILPNVPTSAGSPLMELAAGSGLGDFLSGSLGLGENPVLTYPEILTSRVVMERTLLSPYPPPSRALSIIDAIRVGGRTQRQRIDNGIRALRGLVDVRANPRSGLISVSAVTADSVLSAYIVQRMLSELNNFNIQSRTSQGQATREFVQARLEEAKGELASAEHALMAFREANMRIGNSPQLQLEQGRLQREVETRADLYRLLARQFELARIEAKRDTPTFSIIEPAEPPVRKYRPKVLLNTLIAALGVIILRWLLVYMRHSSLHGRGEASGAAIR